MRAGRGLPYRWISPESGWSAPNINRIVSDRPEPISPAKPRISPRRSSKLTSRTVSARRRPRTRRTTSPAAGRPVRCTSPIVRPTIMRMISSSVTSSVRRVPITRPSRRTVTRSPIRLISSILCEMYTMHTPSAFRRRTCSKRSSISPSVSAAVGSSRISRSQRRDSPAAISTICRVPTPRSPTGVAGSSPARPTRAMMLAASSCSRRRRTTPSALGIRFRKMFSATLSVVIRFSSCITIRMPAASASALVDGA